MTTLTRLDTGSPQALSASYASDCRVASKPSRKPMPWQTIASSRVAVTFGSFCRSEPAAELRGLAKGALPASSKDALSFSKAATDRKISPRTSTRAGGGNFLDAFSRCGMFATVRTFCVTSSPVRPSPRVRARTSLPSS